MYATTIRTQITDNDVRYLLLDAAGNYLSDWPTFEAARTALRRHNDEVDAENQYPNPWRDEA